MIRLEWIVTGLLFCASAGFFGAILLLGDSNPAVGLGATFGLAVLAFFVLAGFLFFRHAHLWLAARWLSPDHATLFLRATADRDWLGAERKGGAGFLISLNRQERFLSRLLGQPVQITDAPSPEAFGGGWIK